MTEIISLRDFCRAERSWLIETIETLVSLESPTTDKVAVDRCGRVFVGGSTGGAIVPGAASAGRDDMFVMKADLR